MASTDFSQHIRQGVEALRNEDAQEPLPGCRAGDLKGLLNSIVDQISDADRRHSDTLQQLQERMAGIGREAKSIKPRVPDSFAGAFERIEAGMAELASRIAEAGESRSDANMQSHDGEPSYRAAAAPATVVAPAAYAVSSSFGEPPAALRSAADTASAATRRRTEEASRAQAGVDTFDVIETTLPGNVSDPWDRDAAEALTGLYETSAPGFPAKSSDMSHAEGRLGGQAFAAMPVQAAVPGLDHLWLEQRFTEISKRIDESLNEIRPDQGFFAIGQRVDQLEQHFSNLIEGVATRGDVEGVRLIEAHVSELAGHLENAHQQLMRLDVIEDHLVGLADKIDDVHRAAMSAPAEDAVPASFSPEIDLQAVARTAAEAAAQQFAKLQPQLQAPQQDGSEVRDMLRGFISESRQGEENTTALLDTLQQAMIRLLDRVDAMEFNAIQNAQSQAQSSPQEYVREQVRFGVEPHARHGHVESEPAAALDAAVAAVASAKTMASPFAQTPGGPDAGSQMQARPAAPSEANAVRSPDKLRQDFIAEARRAKMRLAAESESEGELGDVTVTRPEMTMTAEAAKAPASAARAPFKASSASAKSAAGPAITPRLKVLALGAVVALAGAWYSMQPRGGQSQPVAASVAPSAAKTPVAASGTTSGFAPASGQAASKEAKSDAPTAAPGIGTEPLAPSLDDGVKPMSVQPGTSGEIVTDEITVGSTSVPLFGVAVDSEKPMTAAEFERAKRQQAMAAVSGQLGRAAFDNPAIPVTPAALLPEAEGQLPAEQGQTNVAKGGMSQSSALDLPPATVGPLSLRMAAASGDPSAEFEVGARLAEGKGTDQSFKDAAKWYQRSASKGFAQAQYRLGTLYERGLGLKTDPARAEDWYKRAAEQGNIKAMHNLAVMSANQTKGSPDYATAASWFEKAAEHGLSDSQFNLAVLHENGLGVEQDLTVAYKWLALAAKSGDKEAVRRRDILQGKLTAEQLKKAESMIGMWKSKRPDQIVNDARKAGEAWKQNPDNGING
ncbi:MAG: tetratricopeptide repeat protein [Hyphomicrobium sp.]